jgi:RNA polymerase sigma factor (sigma-70 family)
VELQDEFASLMQRISEGSEDAVKELLEKYGPYIFHVVRRKLNKKLRSKFDSEDFAQSVWASYFAVPRSGADFRTPEALIAFLVNMARNKVADAMRLRHGHGRYNVNRERSLDGSAALQVEAVAEPGPTPSQVVGAKEQFDRVVEKLPTHQRIILEFLRHGYTHVEIAEKLGIDEKTIRRLIRRIAPELLPDDGFQQAASI